MFLLCSVVAFSWIFVRRALRESCFFSAAGLSYAVSSMLLLALANFSAAYSSVAVFFLIGSCLVVYRWEAKPFQWPRLSLFTRASLAALLGLIVLYSALSLNLFIDDDFWIHFPLQGLLQANGLPVLHPFFSDIEMRGHYGRDLLIATVSSQTGLSLLHSLFWQTLLTQVASFFIVCGMVYRSTRSELSTLLASFFIFMGVHVGLRGGLLDCYQNNNALAYLITLSCLHLFFLVYRKPTVSRVVAAGWMLGAFALVYETHFGLLGLLLISGVVLTRQRRWIAVGLLALGLALVQGGPITELVKSKFESDNRVWTPGELNQHQIVKLTVPKKELFQIQLAQGNYQRRSGPYNLLPDLGRMTSITPGTPYRPIWSWDVLQIHWVVTLFAPFSLLVFLRRRPDFVGLCFWIFGAFSFLIPGLVHFGPIYEFEYFRWQFAAGFGFAGALGIAAGQLLDDRSPTMRMGLASVLVFFTVGPWLPLFLPRVASAFADRGELRDAFWPRGEASWILAKSSQLGGFGKIDLLAARRIRSVAKKSERVIVNSPWRKAPDIHFESTLIAISGIRAIGHSLPWPQEPVGTPPFHRSAPLLVFWEMPSELLLDQLQADWVYLRPDGKPLEEMTQWLDEHADLVWELGDHRLFKYERTGRGAFSGIGGESSETTPQVLELPTTLKTAEFFEFTLVATKSVWAWGFIPTGSTEQDVDLHEVVVGSGGSCGGVAPPVPGSFELVFFEVNDGVLRPSGLRVPIEVVERVGLP